MSDESRNQTVKRAASAPMDVAVAPPTSAKGVDDTVVTQELRRCLSALGPGFSMTMMFSAALLIGSGVAVEWALPDFAPLPAAIALGCFAGALTLPLYARFHFRKALTLVGVRLGLPEAEARARANQVMRDWSLVNRLDTEG